MVLNRFLARGTPNIKYKFGGTLISKSLKKTPKNGQNLIISKKNYSESQNQKKSAAHLVITHGTQLRHGTPIEKH